MPPESPATPAGVLALDRLSEHLLGAAAGLRVAVARIDAEREAAFRLRHEQVMAEGWADGKAPADGLEHDGYDADALHVCAWHDGVLIGTVRVVLPAPNRPLPVEAAFGLTVEPRGAVVEAGRLVIAPAHRGDPAHAAWGALFACAWLELRSRGFALLAGSATPRMVERLRRLGLPFEILGPARPYWGEDRHPVRLDPAHSRPRWF
jgi:N-acyl-L-homoserine lactone synthetase